ncbi:MAG: undecaprenyl-diphosphate phosphatase [Bacillota bacterium]|nr:undecaprenyl-diphosphate phosphatase [Bacillota bacterium]
MSLLQTIIYGVISGLCHMSPISWSGHLSLVQYFWGDFQEPSAFLTLVYTALLLAIIIFFRKDLWRLLRHPLQRYTYITLCAALVGTAAGIVFKDNLASTMPWPWLTVVLMAVTTVLLWMTGKYHGKKRIIDMSAIEALLIGLFGALSLFPGLSFPAIVIFLAMQRGVNKQSAFKFSYIIMIPILLGLILRSWYDALFFTGTFVITPQEGIAAVIAGFAGFLAIYMTQNLLEKRKYYRFSLYCLIVVIISAGALLLGM